MSDHDHDGAPVDPVWTDKAWDDWKDYADDVTVQIRFKDWAGADDADERWLLSTDGAAWPKDWLSRQLVEMAAADAVNSCCGTGNYMLDARDRKTEWGASGAAYEAVLTLSENLLTEATFAALGVVGDRMVQRLRAAHPEWGQEDEPLTTEGVESSALWAIVSAFDVQHESLNIRSTEILDKHNALAEVEHSHSSRRFTVEVRSQAWLRVARVRKITND